MWIPRSPPFRRGRDRPAGLAGGVDVSLVRWVQGVQAWGLGPSKRPSCQGGHGTCSPASVATQARPVPVLYPSLEPSVCCGSCLPHPGHVSASLSAGHVSQSSVLVAAVTRSRRHRGRHTELDVHCLQARLCPRPTSSCRGGRHCPQQRWGLPAHCPSAQVCYQQVWVLPPLTVPLSRPAGSQGRPPTPHRPQALVPS